jgi:hypothetical protein
MNDSVPENDLLTVGPRKPLGYMPLDELEDPVGLVPELQSRGLVVMVLGPSECSVKGGAMVAYDVQALGQLLKSRSGVLTKNRWPSDPDVFARYHMSHNAPFRTDLYDLIADAYADFLNPFRKDLRSAVKSSVRYVKFGVLRACHSHLF